jgi:HEAT repeat protein
MNQLLLPLILAVAGLAHETSAAWAANSSEDPVPALIRKLKNTNTSVRAESALALAESGPLAADAIPELIATMGDEDEEVRSCVALALAKIGTAAVLPLTKELGNKDPVVRSLAARSLGMVKPAPVVAATPLVKSLCDNEAGVRREATWALGRIRDESSLPALIDLIDREKDTDVRRSIIETIGEFGAKADNAIPILIRTVKNPSSYLGSAWSGGGERGNDLGSIAAQSLAKVGSASAIPLLDVFTDPKCERMPRLSAGWGLSLMGPDASAAVPRLIIVLEGSDEKLRLMSITVLKGIGPKASDAVPALVNALDDPSSWIRCNSAVALCNVCPRNGVSVPVLARCLKDGNTRVRFFAATELGLIGPAA